MDHDSGSILSVAVILILSVLLTILTMTISSIVPNRIVLIGVQIVVVFVMIAVGANFVVQDVINLWSPQLFVPSLLSGFAIVTLVFMWVVWKRELKRDCV